MSLSSLPTPVKRADQSLARKLSPLQLSQRLTEDQLANLQNHAPGPKTAVVLEELMAQSAFLDPPPNELTSAPPPPIPEQRAIYQRCVEYLATYTRRLPNLIGTENIRRFDDDPVLRKDERRPLGSLFFSDSIGAQVTYENGSETVAIQILNSLPYTAARVVGVSTNGEFGNIIIALALPETKTKAYWSHWETLHGQRLAVFHYSVALANSQYSLSYRCGRQESQSVKPSYSGSLFIDPKTGAILRVTRTSADIPPGFPIQQANTAVEYGPISVGDHVYILPLLSVTESDNPLACEGSKAKSRLHSLNIIRFSNYRLFEAESKLVTSDEARKLAESAPPPLPPSPPPTEPVPELPASLEELPAAPTPSPEPAKPEASKIDVPVTPLPTFRDRLNLVAVPVVVSDAAGHPVSGLYKDDFELFADGQRQTISGFTEERASQTSQGSQPQPSPPDRHLVFVFDDLNLSPGQLSQTRSALERVLDSVLTPTTRVAIQSISGKLSLPFTNNRDKIIAALDQIKPTSRTGPSSNCPVVSYYMADRILNKNDRAALQIETDAAIAQCDSRSIQQAQIRAEEAARMSLTLHNSETRDALVTLQNLIRNLSVLPGDRSLVIVSPGFFINFGAVSLQELIAGAVRSGLVINVLDAKGLGTQTDLDVEETGAISVNKFSYQQDEQQITDNPLVQFTSSTGGKLFRNSNNFDAGLKSLTDPPAIRYVLAFIPPEGETPGSYHKLKVTVKGYKSPLIQARLGYTSDQLAKNDLQNALFSRDEARDIPLTAKSTIADSQLTLLLHIDLKNLPFQKSDSLNHAALTFSFAFFDANGTLLSLLKQDLPLAFSDTELRARLSHGIDIKSNFALKPDAQFLRIVLRTPQGQTSTLTQPIRPEP